MEGEGWWVRTGGKQPLCAAHLSPSTAPQLLAPGAASSPSCPEVSAALSALKLPLLRQGSGPPVRK